MPVLADLAAGIVTEPRRCDGLTRVHGAGDQTCTLTRGLDPSGRDAQGWLPEVRRQCLEATYDADRGGWTCTRTGERCGEGRDDCRTPDRLYTYVPDYAQTVRKVEATGDGEPVLGAAAVDSLGTGSTYLLAAAGVLLVLFLGRKP